MANPIGTLTKVVGFGVQTGASVLGKAVQTVQGFTGQGGGQEEEQEQAPRAEQQRQRTQRAATQRRASRQPKPLGDVAITRKVETEIFRSSDVDKGKINVNTAEGVVWLRGEAKNPEQVKELEAKAAAIPEVKRVENLLHLPKTPAPTRTDSPPSQRKTRSTKTSAAARKVTPARTTAEKSPTTPAAEPAPADLAAARSGRRPAPLDDDSGNGGSPSSG
jgi:hypothetical protein